MPSLRNLLRTHSPLLLLDASSQRIQAGLLGPDPARWASRTEEAGVGVFACLEDLGVDPGAVAAFAFCEGPGSILGIRTSAMALRVWDVLQPRPLFAFQSLAVAATGAGRPGATLIADARRGLWHCLPVGGTLARVPAAELTGELLTPEGFRAWAPLPAGTAVVPYDLAALFALPAVADADLFRPSPAPDAFLHEEPAYAKWVPQIHRAP